MQRLTHFCRFRFLAALSLLCQAVVLSQGCASGASSSSHQPKAPHATVYFEEVADWSFEAAHPATIAEAAIRHTLGGLYLDDRPSSHTSSADGSKPMRVFSDEDVEYLAPLLARALSQAQPEYVVAFRLSSSAGSGSEPTAGTLYVKDQELYVTLTAYQGSASQTDSSSSGQAAIGKTVSFVPESAAHRQKADPTVALGRRDLISLAIDYNMLSKQSDQVHVESAVPMTARSETKEPERLLVAGTMSDQAIMPATAAAVEPQAVNGTEQELMDAQRTIARKDAKIDQLRHDLESMRQQLEARDKELRQVKSKPAPIKREKRGKAELVIR